MVQINRLNPAQSVGSSDLVPIWQNGRTFGATVGQIRLTAATVAELRALTGADGSAALLLGSTAAGDGGAGAFYWSTTSTVADDAFSVVKPTATTGAGRWLRLVEDSAPRNLPKSYFGLHFQTASSLDSPRTPLTDFGHGWVRLWDCRTTWRLIETSQGVNTWTRLDELVALHEAAGKEIVYTLGQAPAWATGGVVGGLGLTTSIYNSLVPTSDAYWTTHITNVATRYRGRITAYEIWNEPESSSFFAGTVADLARLTLLASQTIRAIDPNARIICAPSTGQIAGPNYLNSYLAQSGVVAAIDVVGCHLYVQPAQPEGVIELARAFRAAADANGAKSLPLWCTEYGYTQYFNSGTFVADADTPSPLIPAALGVSYMTRLLLAPWLGGCARAAFYGVDHAAMKLTLVNPASLSTVLPAGQAYQKIAQELTGSWLDNLEQQQGCNVLSYTRSTGSRAYLVWTTDDGSASVDLTQIGASAGVTDDGTGTFPTAVIASIDTPIGSVGTSAVKTTVTKTPLILEAAHSNTPSHVGAANSQVLLTDLTFNSDFRSRTSSGNVPDGWTSNAAAALSAYTGTDSTGYAITFTPTAATQQFRQTQRQPLAAGRYQIQLKYLLPTSQTSEWYLALEDSQGSASLYSTGTLFSRSLFPASQWTIETREFVVAEDTTYPYDWRILLSNSASSAWNPISIEYLRVVRVDPVQPKDRHDITTLNLPARPTRGGTSYSQGTRIVFTDPAQILAEFCSGLIVSQGGTLGTLVGATAIVSSSSRTITSVPVSTIKLGDYITVAGSAKVYRVLAKNSTTSWVLDQTPDVSGSGLALAFSAPVFYRWGLIADDTAEPLLGVATTTSATNGTGAAMPANIEKFLPVKVGGVDYRVPMVKP